MFGLSFTHLLLLTVMALIFIGPEQLPGVARTLGRFINELKRASNSLTDEFKRSVDVNDLKDHGELGPHPEVKPEEEKKDDSTSG
jgi:sec-independent protein translocase protein TatB